MLENVQVPKFDSKNCFSMLWRRYHKLETTETTFRYCRILSLWNNINNNESSSFNDYFL